MTSLVAAEERQKALIGELSHRVKNTLAVVCSIAEHSLPEGEGKQRLLGRFHALAQTHDLLTRARWDDLPLHDLVMAELTPYAGAERGIVRIDGAPVILKPHAALTLGLVLHELATNAAKYGALSTDAGRIDIAWTITGRGPAQLRLCWREYGGPEVTRLPRRGFGTNLIEHSMPYELQGKVKLEVVDKAVHCTIAIPASPKHLVSQRRRAQKNGGNKTSERRRILVVEDNHLNAKLVMEVLQLAGWQVVGPVGRLSEAMDIAARNDFAAAVLDVNLAGEDVYPVAAMLSERRVPFAFLTGYDAGGTMPGRCSARFASGRNSASRSNRRS